MWGTPSPEKYCVCGRAAIRPRCLQTLWQLMGQLLGCLTACCHQVGLSPTSSLFPVKAQPALSGPRTVAAGGITEEMWGGKLQPTRRIPPQRSLWHAIWRPCTLIWSWGGLILLFLWLVAALSHGLSKRPSWMVSVHMDRSLATTARFHLK